MQALNPRVIQAIEGDEDPYQVLPGAAADVWVVCHPMELDTSVYRYPSGLWRCARHPGDRACPHIQAVRAAEAAVLQKPLSGERAWDVEHILVLMGRASAAILEGRTLEARALVEAALSETRLALVEQPGQVRP